MPAESGTLKGELLRGWQRLAALSWKWKAAIVAVAFFLVVGIIGSATSSDKASDNKAQAAAPTETKATATAAATTPAPTNTAASTNTPAATNTPAPPTATPTPLSFEGQVLKSYRDNRDFMTRAVGDPVDVVWTPSDGTLIFNVSPKTVGSGGDSLTIAAHSAIVASKAIWTTYPQVKVLIVNELEDFTDATGNTKKQVGVSSTIERALGEQFNFDGLKSRALSDNKLWFCGASNYFIHPAVYRDLGDKGCLLTWGTVK